MSEEIKQEQKPTQKKAASYTYWVDEKSKGRQLPEQHKPKKIDPPPQVAHQNGGGPSRWNSSGTWEERTVPMKELAEKVEEAIRGWLGQGEGALVLKQVDLQGEVVIERLSQSRFLPTISESCCLKYLEKSYSREKAYKSGWRTSAAVEIGTTVSRGKLNKSREDYKRQLANWCSCWQSSAIVIRNDDSYSAQLIKDQQSQNQPLSEWLRQIYGCLSLMCCCKEPSEPQQRSQKSARQQYLRQISSAVRLVRLLPPFLLFPVCYSGYFSGGQGRFYL